MSNSLRPSSIEELRARLNALQNRVDLHDRLLREVESELRAQRGDLLELKGVVQALDARQRRTIWRAAAVISAAAPLVGETLRHLMP